MDQDETSGIYTYCTRVSRAVPAKRWSNDEETLASDRVTAMDNQTTISDLESAIFTTDNRTLSDYGIRIGKARKPEINSVQEFDGAPNTIEKSGVSPDLPMLSNEQGRATGDLENDINMHVQDDDETMVSSLASMDESFFPWLKKNPFVANDLAKQKEKHSSWKLQDQKRQISEEHEDELLSCSQKEDDSQSFAPDVDVILEKLEMGSTHDTEVEERTADWNGGDDTTFADMSLFGGTYASIANQFRERGMQQEKPIRSYQISKNDNNIAVVERDDLPGCNPSTETRKEDDGALSTSEVSCTDRSLQIISIVKPNENGSDPNTSIVISDSTGACERDQRAEARISEVSAFWKNFRRLLVVLIVLLALCLLLIILGGLLLRNQSVSFGSQANVQDTGSSFDD